MENTIFKVKYRIISKTKIWNSWPVSIKSGECPKQKQGVYMQLEGIQRKQTKLSLETRIL